MADKSIGELIEATHIMGSDMFLLQQSGSAKKLGGQTLINWLLAQLDGHGGVHTVVKTRTVGLVDTYTLTFADQTTTQFSVTNGKGVSDITKTSTAGLVDTYLVSYTDGTSTSFDVTNGEKGDKGDNAHCHIKWASQLPTAASHSFGDLPDNCIGVYTGISATAPTDWQQYSWFRIKGDKGNTGSPAALLSSVIEYQATGSSAIPTGGTWLPTVPVVPQGQYLWTRKTEHWNTGGPIVSYSVARQGIDGLGSVATVNGKSPDTDGNILLSAEDIGAVPTSRSVNGKLLTSDITLNAADVGARPTSWTPTASDVGARPNTWTPTAAEVGAPIKLNATVTLTAGGWSNNAQTVSVAGVTTSCTVVVSPAPADFVAYGEAQIRCTAQGSGSLTFQCESAPSQSVSVNVLILK